MLFLAFLKSIFMLLNENSCQNIANEECSDACKVHLNLLCHRTLWEIHSECHSTTKKKVYPQIYINNIKNGFFFRAAQTERGYSPQNTSIAELRSLWHCYNLIKVRFYLFDRTLFKSLPSVWVIMILKATNRTEENKHRKKEKQWKKVVK